MAFPPPETDWHALHDEGFAHVVRLHPADYDPAPLIAHDVVLEDLYGGASPHDPAAEQRRIWDAADLIAAHVTRGEGVVVHCVGGTGRTGTVLACTLRRLRPGTYRFAAVALDEWGQSVPTLSRKVVVRRRGR